MSTPPPKTLEYDENSINARLATIIANQTAHGLLLAEVRDEAKKTNGRVNKLEQEKWYTRGVTAAIALLAPGAWASLFKS